MGVDEIKFKFDEYVVEHNMTKKEIQNQLLYWKKNPVKFAEWIVGHKLPWYKKLLIELSIINGKLKMIINYSKNLIESMLE